MADDCSSDALNSGQRSLRVDDFQFHSESDKQWTARRQFIIKHVAEYEAKNKVDHLLSLSMVWANHVFMGCRYDSDLMQKVLEMAEGINVGERPNFQLVAGEAKKRSGSCNDGEEIFRKIPRFGPRFEPVPFVASSGVDEKEDEDQATAGTSLIAPTGSAASASPSPQNTAAFVFDPWATVRVHGSGEQQPEIQQHCSVGTEVPGIKQSKPASVNKRQEKSLCRGLGFTDQEAVHTAHNVLSAPPSSSGPKPISPDTLNEGQQFITRLSSAIAVTLVHPGHNSTSYYNSVLNRSLEAVNSHLQYTYLSLQDLSPGELPKDHKSPSGGYVCELRCQSICIATGYAGTKKAARKRASEMAVKLLQKPVEVRVMQHRHRYEMVACSKDDSARQLATPLRDPDDKSAPSGGDKEERGRWYNFAIVENAQDAISILGNSANLNGMKIDYRFDELPMDGLWRCCVCLDGEPVAQAKGRSKKIAKLTAAKEALEKLRQNNATREEQWKPYGSTNPHLTELVILENDSNAVGIINNTAQFNKVPVVYDLTQLRNRQWKCKVFLGGQFVAEAVGPKKSVKQMAAEIALGTLRQTHVVVKRRAQQTDSEDAISREQITGRSDPAAALPAIKDDNIGKQLLRKMGWTGGGLGREGEGIAEPINVKEQIAREGLGLESQKPAHELDKRDLEAIIQRYSTSEQRDDLRFSADLDNAERKKIHQLCQKYGLRSKSYGQGTQRFLIVSHKVQSKLLIEQLIKEGQYGQCGQYELVKPLN
ncbi:NF-kappa-B-repressing factor-like [Brienomyrus brachyistius]|uniref:NF-kappa-B-repressing factor-like n=1 Tax=Brienomyrus brachyistius TaxID=42636 RepID=UPI0020B1D558|nr:NF-kappa-B-repressing factor-like [Brienomyrus brachyistius]